MNPSTPRRAICAAAFIVLITSTTYVVHLRSRLAKAERYAASGASSVYLICNAVAWELEEAPTDVAAITIAKTCIGGHYWFESDVIRREFRRRDGRAVASRLRARMNARLLPLVLTEMEEDSLPNGLRD